MKVIVITGPIGSGKSTLDANVRMLLGLKGDRKFNINGHVAAIGPMVRISEKGKVIPLKYSGLDAFEGFQKPKNPPSAVISRIVRKLKAFQMEIVIMSGMPAMEKAVQNHPDVHFCILVQLHSAGRIREQRLKRRNYLKPAWVVTKSDQIRAVEKSLQWAKNLIKRWECRGAPNVEIKPLQGSTKDRIKAILACAGRSDIKDFRVARTPYAKRYLKHWL